MCGLFGFSRYGGTIKNLSEITNSLAEQSAVRGTDATGIAFNGSGGIRIFKDGKPAYKMDFKHPDEIRALIGHTRHSTGAPSRAGFNYNNHPFGGSCINSKFALAHNGIIHNDKTLKKSLSLPKSKIETDSFVSVQILEKYGELNLEKICDMAEAVEGSFSFSILDDKNNIYLVKGDSPLSILHFPGQKLYLYASTDEILYRSIIDTPLFEDLKKGEFEVVDIKEGDVLKIFPDGTIKKGSFEFKQYYGRNWWDFGLGSCRSSLSADEEYIDDLKSIASYQGFDPDTIDELIASGITTDEIENFLYEW